MSELSESERNKLFESEINCSEAELIEKRNRRNAIERIESDIIYALEQEAKSLIVFQWEHKGIGVNATLESVPHLLERIRNLIGFLADAECRLKKEEQE